MEPSGNVLRGAGLDLTFAALADPTRRAILARLSRGEATVAELAEPFAMTQPAVSKHLRVLEAAGLVKTRQDAQKRPRRLEAKPLGEASAWLAEYRRLWEGRYRQLDRLLDELQGRAPRGKARGRARGAGSKGKRGGVS